MQLPSQSSATSQWKVWDYRSAQLLSPAAAGGLARCEMTTPVPDNELWFIDRLLVQSNSVARTTAFIYANERVIDGTSAGNFNVADMSTPHLLKGTELLAAEWVGATAGAIAQLYVQYTVLRRPDA